VKFLDYIRNGFTRVLAVDTEYLSDITGTIPQRVLCVVYIDIFTGEVFRFWEDNKRTGHRHFDYDECLLVSFSATAEYGSYLNLLHGKPKYMWDCFVENKRLYFPFIGKDKTGMLDTCGRYNIENIGEADKEEELDFILKRNKYEGQPFEYDSKDQKRIMDYCQSDVEATAQLFISQAQDIEVKNHLTKETFEQELWQICFRGYVQGCVAQIERNGIPVDNYRVSLFRDYWPKVKDTIITKINKRLNVYREDLSFSNELFKGLVARAGLKNSWPVLKSGYYSRNDKVVEKFEDHHPLIKEYRQLSKLLNTTKLSFYLTGNDGRVRARLNMFGTLTSRCSPSSSKYPLGASKWARNFIKPSMGNRLVYIDYVAQEPAIQGYLSGDETLIKNYLNGDVYINTAISMGLINDPNATKKSHRKQRDVIKELFLANTYGMGPHSVAERLDVSLFKAKESLKRFKDMYKTYFKARDGWLNGTAITGNLRTQMGWQRFIKGNKKWKDGKAVSITNQLKNFLIQSTGADILRKAIVKLTDNHFKIVATLHDAILVEIDCMNFKEDLSQCRTLMEKSAEEVCGGIIRTDAEIIESNWKQDSKHQELFDEIFEEIRKYKIEETTRDLRGTY
tara:strand:- start:528 stop:2390 length:1863 start_codon:yes stop_codon:yes gene_type:complete